MVAVGFEEGMSYHFGNNAGQVTAISQVNIMKHNVAMSNMSILIEMISAVYSNYWPDALCRALRSPFQEAIQQETTQPDR